MIIANKSGVGVSLSLGIWRAHRAAPALNHFLWIQFARPAFAFANPTWGARCSILFYYYDVRAPLFHSISSNYRHSGHWSILFVYRLIAIKRAEHFTHLMLKAPSVVDAYAHSHSRSAPPVVCNALLMDGFARLLNWRLDLHFGSLLLFLAHFAMPMLHPTALLSIFSPPHNGRWRFCPRI